MPATRPEVETPDVARGSEVVRESPDRAGRARREQREARRPSLPAGYVREEQRGDATRIRSGDGRGFLHSLSVRQEPPEAIAEEIALGKVEPERLHGVEVRPRLDAL